MRKVSKKPVIAIAGATGLVGSEMLVVLAERNVPCAQLKLLASKDSAGEVYKFHDQEVEVETLTPESFAGVDIALFGTSAEISASFVPQAVQAGAVCIDNSSFFRMKPEVPLVVPEVNFSSIGEGSSIIANPNCSTIQLVPVLKVVHEIAGLRHVVVSTYQSVSGAGKAALDELWGQTLAIFNQQEFAQEEFQHQIAFNCIPQIDVFLDDGFTKEEHKIIQESRKILGLPDLRITATAVRVPVFYGHGESVFIETEKPFELAELSRRLEHAPGISLRGGHEDFPMQCDVAGTDDVHVGRLRRDASVPNGISLWVVADNVRKGAAVNAVQIAERLIASS